MSSFVIAKVAKLLSPKILAWESEKLESNVNGEDIFCRTLYSAISPGTELAAYIGLPSLRDIPQYPRVVGYCNVAEVMEVGSDVSSVARGDRVLSFKSHRSHFILNEKEIFVRLKSGICLQSAAVAYLFHLGYSAVMRSEIKLGSRVAILGIGPIGLGCIALSRMAGAEVTAISNYRGALELGQQFGAKNAFARMECEGLSNSMDVVISTTNSWDDWQLALNLAAPLGRLAVLGFPGRGVKMPKNFNPLSSRFFYEKQLSIEAMGIMPERPDAHGFLRFNLIDNLEYILRKISDNEIGAKSLISAVFPAKELEQAYEALLVRKNSECTILLEW
jgi:threonine dehydrogenase-like Zn-dependent dehydrogenase